MISFTTTKSFIAEDFSVDSCHAADMKAVDQELLSVPDFRDRYREIRRDGRGRALAVDRKSENADMCTLWEIVEAGRPIVPSLVTLSTTISILDNRKVLTQVLLDEAARNRLLCFAPINVQDENHNITTALHKMTRHQANLDVFLANPEAAALFCSQLTVSQGFGYPDATLAATLLVLPRGRGITDFLDHSPDAAKKLIYAVQGPPNYHREGSETEMIYDYHAPRAVLSTALKSQGLREIFSRYSAFHYWLNPSQAPKTEEVPF